MTLAWGRGASGGSVSVFYPGGLCGQGLSHTVVPLRHHTTNRMFPLPGCSLQKLTASLKPPLLTQASSITSR